jgi:hypothetical protein
LAREGGHDEGAPGQRDAHHDDSFQSIRRFSVVGGIDIGHPLFVVGSNLIDGQAVGTSDRQGDRWTGFITLEFCIAGTVSKILLFIGRCGHWCDSRDRANSTNGR